MMNKLFYIVSIFLISSNHLLLAQKTNIPNNQYLNNESCFTFNLLSPVNISAPSWRLGYIRSVTPRFKIGLDAGFGNHSASIFVFDNTIEDAYVLWEIRPEMYYFLRSKERRARYFSVELFYLNQTDIFHRKRYYPKHEKEIVWYERANYHRHKYGVMLKYGLIWNLYKNFGFNFYAGFGGRVVDNQYSNVINPKIDYDSFIEGFDFYKSYSFNEGININIDIAIGIRLIYRLKTDKH